MGNKYLAPVGKGCKGMCMLANPSQAHGSDQPANLQATGHKLYEQCDVINLGHQALYIFIPYYAYRN